MLLRLGIGAVAQTKPGAAAKVTVANEHIGPSTEMLANEEVRGATHQILGNGSRELSMVATSAARNPLAEGREEREDARTGTIASRSGSSSEEGGWMASEEGSKMLALAAQAWRSGELELHT